MIFCLKRVRRWCICQWMGGRMAHIKVTCYRPCPSGASKRGVTDWFSGASRVLREVFPKAKIEVRLCRLLVLCVFAV